MGYGMPLAILSGVPRPPAWAREYLPEALTSGGFGGVAWWQWLGLLLLVIGAALLGMLLGSTTVRVSSKIAENTTNDLDDRLIKVVRGPVRMVIGTILFVAGLEVLDLADGPRAVIARIVRIVATIALAWLVVRLIRMIGRLMQDRAVERAEEEGDGIKARKVRTQVLVLQRVLVIATWVLALALILMQFEVVRSVGVSLLASAGVAGIVFGLAAQKSIGNLLMGIQLSITQPVRIGDTVIVEGEWGQIEEINLTYVVVRIWDQRRLVVPISKFLDQPFQNWTKKETELIGVVFFHADYRLPVPKAREHLEAILKEQEKWDERAFGLVVTDATERTIQVRCTMSAKDAGDAWDLRCAVREKMIEWLKELEGGRYLPVLRVDAESEKSDEG
jgi:small-conductance mechanosensitive channel